MEAKPGGNTELLIVRSRSSRREFQEPFREGRAFGGVFVLEINVGVEPILRANAFEPGGELAPIVVEAAKAQVTPIRSRFEWNFNCLFGFSDAQRGVVSPK